MKIKLDLFTLALIAAGLYLITRRNQTGPIAARQDTPIVPSVPQATTTPVSYLPPQTEAPRPYTVEQDYLTDMAGFRRPVSLNPVL